MKTLRIFGALAFLLMPASSILLAQTTPTPLDVVKQCYQDFAQGNIPGLISALSDDIIWIDPGRVGPYAGKREGKASILDFFTQLHEQLNITRFEPYEYVVEGNKACVTGYVEGIALATGAPFASDWAMAWEITPDGKVAYHHLYLDTDNIGKAIASKDLTQTGRNFIAAMDASDLEGLKACVSPDFTIYHPNFPHPLNLQGFFDMQVKPFNAAFQGMAHTLLDASCDGRKLCMRGIASGKHTGVLMGIEPTGNDIAVPWLAFTTLDSNGKIREMHVQFNQLAFLAQLGVNPMASK
ncbi:MAG: nuclear transport factor 2 family protein [Phaeodactylibacter sp.]|nr:nuclear transport factor 2 family protein [Phaeodactylibacter sp.]